MNFTTFKRICIALALIAPVASASAAIVTVNQTVDLTQFNLAGGNIQKFYGGTPLTLNIGDTLNLSYDFLGNQTLIMNAPSYIYGWVAASSGSTSFTSTGSMTLVGATGPVKTASETATDGCAHFGNTFFANQFTTAPGPISFSGMQFSMTVDAYTGDLTTRDYSGPWLVMGGSGMSIGSAIPEPGSIALLGLGLAALAFAGKRKRA